ncbi:hypothetical protein [uncultured Variovorax sp.]
MVVTFGNVAGGPLQVLTANTITWTRQTDRSWDCRVANTEPKDVGIACSL